MPKALNRGHDYYTDYGPKLAYSRLTPENRASTNEPVGYNRYMNKDHLLFYAVSGGLVIIYFIGEATGYLFFAFLIIVPTWVWLLNKLTGN